jgi:general secretion pathway protein F
MPDYQYWATTEGGDTVNGRLTAVTPDDAAHLLTLRGWVLQRLEESPAAPPVSAEPLALAERDFTPVEASPRDLESGLPLVANLRALAEETGRPRTRRAIFAVISAVEQGRPWDQALGELEAAMPRRFGALIQAGVATGRLPFLMFHALDYLRRMHELRRRLWFSLCYPAALIAFAGGVIAFLLLLIVPNFKHIFYDFGITLPVMTTALIALSDAGVAFVSLFGAFGWRGNAFGLILAVAVVLIAMMSASALSNVPRVQRFRQRLVRIIPVVGPVLSTASLSGWFRLVAMLVEARFPLPEAMRIAAAVNGDALLSAGVERIIGGINAGESPFVAAERAETLPREVLPVFRWAENRKLFGEGMRGAADIYAARSRTQSGLVAVLLEPMLVFGIGITVGLAVIAIFLPLINLVGDLV